MCQLWADHLLALPLFPDHVFNSSLWSIVIGYTPVHWPRVSCSPSWVTAQTELQLSTVSMCLMAPWRANYSLFKRVYWLIRDQRRSRERGHRVCWCRFEFRSFSLIQGLSWILLRLWKCLSDPMKKKRSRCIISQMLPRGGWQVDGGRYKWERRQRNFAEFDGVCVCARCCI